jgi:hypothetical protein
MAMFRKLPKAYLIALVFDYDHEARHKVLKVADVVIECAAVHKGRKRWQWTGSSVDGIVQYREYDIGQRREVDWKDPEDLHNVIGIYDRRDLGQLTAMATHAAEAQKALDALPPDP